VGTVKKEGVPNEQINIAAGGLYNFWKYNDRVDCPFYSGCWICAVCIRSGFDLRITLCPLGAAP
jgi:hypothetical protein